MEQTPQERQASMQQRIINLKEKVKQMQDSVKNNKAAAWAWRDKHEFLVQRIKNVYGVRAYIDLISHVEYPDQETLQRILSGYEEEKESKETTRETN